MAIALLWAGHARAQDVSTFAPPSDASSLEQLYSTRTGTSIRRLGHLDLGGDSGANPGLVAPPLPSTAPGDNRVENDQQILSVGDRVKIWLRGGQNREEEQAITSDGTLILRDLPPIPANGQSLAALRQLVRDQVKQQYPDTDAYVTLAGLRPIQILVSGAVRHPGPIQIPANSDILAAIRAAGGIMPLGSHRALNLTRGNTRPQTIDLYPVLQGGAAPMPLRDGDRLDIAPIGRTVALAGAVKNPAIIELAPGQPLSLQAALDLTGGPLMPRGSRLMLSRLDDQGREQQTRITQSASLMLEDGDIVTITAQTAPESGGVRLVLPGRAARTMPLDDAPTLGRLLDDPAIIGQNLYPLCGVIRRQPGDGFAGELIAFAPASVRNRDHDRRLEDRDEIILFAADAFPAPTGQQPIDPDDQTLKAFLAEQNILVTGAVRRPGAYPVGGQIPASQLLASAGGTTREATPNGLEILYRESGDIVRNDPQAASRLIEAGDAVRVAGNPRGPGKSVVHVAGAVQFPGDYPIQPGETLSSVLRRAGGLTDSAYPAGAVFTRISEQKNEQARYLEAARHLDAALSRQLAAEEKPDRALIDTTRSLSRELRQSTALGRISITADPGLLASNPDLDLLLEDGDRITFPQRAPIIRVMGEVQSPATLQFVSGKKPADYLAEAGGLSALADAGRGFVLLPDGRSWPLAGDFWRRNREALMPGSTIIIPRDVKPLDSLQMTSAVGNIIGQIAITAAAIASIHNNND